MPKRKWHTWYSVYSFWRLVVPSQQKHTPSHCYSVVECIIPTLPERSMWGPSIFESLKKYGHFVNFYSCNYPLSWKPPDHVSMGNLRWHHTSSLPLIGDSQLPGSSTVLRQGCEWRYQDTLQILAGQRPPIPIFIYCKHQVQMVIFDLELLDSTIKDQRRESQWRAVSKLMRNLDGSFTLISAWH